MNYQEQTNVQKGKIDEWFYMAREIQIKIYRYNNCLYYSDDIEIKMQNYESLICL